MLNSILVEIVEILIRKYSKKSLYNICVDEVLMMSQFSFKSVSQCAIVSSTVSLKAYLKSTYCQKMFTLPGVLEDNNR